MASAQPQNQVRQIPPPAYALLEEDMPFASPVDDSPSSLAMNKASIINPKNASTALSAGSEEECILCMSNLADVIFPCGHRITCQECATAHVARGRGRAKCPKCRASSGGGGVGGLAVDKSQCKPVCLSEIDDKDTVEFRSLGFKLKGCPQPGHDVDEKFLQQVRDAMKEVKAGHLKFDKLQSELKTKLTVAQMQVVQIQLFANTDLYQVVSSRDELALHHYEYWKRKCQRLIVTCFEAERFADMTIETTLSRSAAATGAAVGMEMMTEGAAQAGKTFSGACQGAAAGACGVVALGLSLFEAYRWGKGEITGKEAWVNVGEHTLTGAAAFGGICAGGGIAAATSCAVPVLWPLGCAILFSFLVKYGYGWCVEKSGILEEDKLEQSRAIAVKAAAKMLRINVPNDPKHPTHGDDSFYVAKIKFREMILAEHPDKFPEEQRPVQTEKAAGLLTSWQLVRGHYERGDVLLDEDEGFISVFVRKTRKTIDEQWSVVRMWFGEKDNAPLVQSALEVVE